MSDDNSTLDDTTDDVPIADNSDQLTADAGGDAGFASPDTSVPDDSSDSSASSDASASSSTASSSAPAAGNAAMPAGTGSTSTATGTVITKTQAYVDAGAALRAAAQAAGAGSLSDSALALLLGQAFGESFFGRAVQGYASKSGGYDTAGTNNWGSIQSTATWEKAHAGQDYWGKYAHTDTHSDGSKYVGWYRIYPNQLEAAKAFLSQVLYGNPSGFAAAIGGGASGYAQWLKDHSYYEASVSDYTTMLARDSRDAASALASGLSPANPSNAGYAEYSIADVSVRVSSGSGTVSPASGVVWFGKPMPAPGGALGGTVGKVLLGLVALALAVGGFLYWKGRQA